MAHPPTLQTSDFRPTALDTLKDVAEQGIWVSVTRYNLPYAEIHPAGTAERIRRLEPPMPETSIYHLDQGRILPSAQALVDTLLIVHHGDRAEAARALLAHIQAEQAALALLLANGGDA